MNKKIVLLGGGGHCKSVLDTLMSLNVYDDIVIVGKHQDIGKDVLGVTCVGIDDELPLLLKDGYKEAFITFVDNKNRRKFLFNNLRKIGFEFPNIIDKSANISKYANLGVGIFAGKNSIINSDTAIGDNVIINTATIVEHDCYIYKFVNIGPGTVVCGGISIGEGTYIGANTVIKPCVCIGKDSIIGAGSVVTKDISDNVIAFGNPCRYIKNNFEGVELNGVENFNKGGGRGKTYQSIPEFAA